MNPRGMYSSVNWLRMVLIGAFIGGLCSIAQAQHVYDFSGTHTGNTAFKGEAATEPPLTNTVPTTAFTAGNYTAIATSDDSRLTVGASMLGDNALVRFVFTLTEPAASVRSLDITWEGNTQSGGTVRLYVWKPADDIYSLIFSTSSTTDTSPTISINIPTDVIDGSTVTVLVANATDNKSINTDFVSITVTQCTTAAECNDGNACTTDACSSFLCTHTNRTAGSICGGTITSCSNLDMCDGDGNCLPNDKPAGANCGDAGTDCTNQDTCNGSGACIDNGFKSGGTLCRASTGACDPAEECDGVSGICPTDSVITSCINSDGCCPSGCNNSNDNDCLFAVCGPGQGDCCVTHANTGCQEIACCHTVCALDSYCCVVEWDQTCVDEALLICEPSGCLPSICGDGIIEVGEDCDPGPDGVGVCCSGECLFESAGTVCRPASGVCDVADTCTGTSAICPADAKNTAQCRASAGVCDLAEFCNGVSNACPEDAKSTAMCRASAGACDLAEFCNGVSNTCPANFVITRCTNSDGCCPSRCNNSNDNDCSTVTVLKWESVLTHGVVVGPVALDIPDTGLFSEPRSGIKKIVVTFDGAINPTTANPANVTVCGNDVTNSPVDLSGIVVTTATTTGDTKMEINFTHADLTPGGLPNFARYRIVINTNIQGAGGGAIQTGAGGLSRIITALQGDAAGGGDRRVNATDLGLVRGLVGTNPIDPGILNHLRSDANNDGRINATDLGLVRGRVGQDARAILEPVCP